MSATATYDLAEWLEERSGRFISISDEIWQKPQVALQESEACALQIADLRAEGFRIAERVGGMPTAFVAEWGEGRPIIGFVGEYDALPNLSQQNGPTQQPVTPGAPGHACGHNLLGTACLAAAVAIKEWLAATGQPGTVRYYGCPAEETITGKVFMARAGVYDDLDAALTWHPGWINTVSKGSSLAVDNLRFRFRGQAAHAAMSPHLGRSALDAVELLNIGVNFLREHVADPVRIHYVITNGGAAPNIVPEEAEVWYFVRAPERSQVEELTARIRKIAEGATLMTETTVEERYLCGAYNVIPNHYLANLALEKMHQLGALEFTGEERDYAQQIVDAYPPAVREQLLASIGVPRALLNQSLVGDIYPALDEGKVMPGSTDVGDMSWLTPTGSIGTATWALGIPAHSWGIVATGAMSIGHKGMLYAAKVLALVAADLYTGPAHLEHVRAEFERATSGQRYRSPLPDGVEPLAE